MISPLPFYLDRKYSNKCKPCCKGRKEFFLPVPAGFIPFQTCVEGLFGGVNQNIKFFGSDDILIIEKDLQVESYTCGGKTYLTSKNCVVNNDYALINSNWDTTGTIDDLSESAVLVSGENLNNTIPFAVGKKYNVEVSVSGTPCPTTVDYTITIEYPTLPTIIIYFGNICQTHIFEIPEAVETATLKFQYGIGADNITVSGWNLDDCPPDDFLPECVEMYARLELDGGIFVYSDMFKVYPTETMDECYIRIDYKNNCSIDCFNPFTGWMFLEYINSALAIPEYPIEVLGDDDDAGNFIQERVKVSKVLTIVTGAVPEYLTDFLNYLQLFDITVTQFGRIYDVETFEVNTEWQQNGCAATVRLLITVDSKFTLKCCSEAEEGGGD